MTDSHPLTERYHNIVQTCAAKRKKIVIFRTGYLGDTLVAMPAISAIRKNHPDHDLVLLTNLPDRESYVSSWDVLKPTGWFDDVIYYEPTQELHTLLKNAITLKKCLEALAPVCLFNLSPNWRPLQRIRDRFFFERIVGVRHYFDGFSAQITIRAARTFSSTIPEWQRLLRITNPDKLADFSLPIPEQERRNLYERIDADNIGTHGQLLAFGPGSKMEAKKWPEERYEILGQQLLERYPNVHLVILGGPEDQKIGFRLCTIWGERGHNYAGVLSIYGSAALLERCVGYVGNDTGTMHLAGLVGTPCVALFSARDKRGRWEPYGTGHIIIRHDTDCRECMLEVCNTHQNLCMKKISVEEVFIAVNRLLAN